MTNQEPEELRFTDVVHWAQQSASKECQLPEALKRSFIDWARSAFARGSVITGTAGHFGRLYGKEATRYVMLKMDDLRIWPLSARMKKKIGGDDGVESLTPAGQ